MRAWAEGQINLKILQLGHLHPKSSKSWSKSEWQKNKSEWLSVKSSLIMVDKIKIKLKVDKITRLSD